MVVRSNFAVSRIEACCPLRRRTTRSAHIIRRLAETGGETVYVDDSRIAPDSTYQYVFLPMTNTLAYTRYMLPEHRLITHSPRCPVDTRSHTAANCAVAESSRYTDLWFPEGSVRVTIDLTFSRQTLLP